MVLFPDSPAPVADGKEKQRIIFFCQAIFVKCAFFFVLLLPSVDIKKMNRVRGAFLFLPKADFMGENPMT